MFCQVFPPSSDLYAPSPHDELWRLFGSPDPTHTTDGSDGAIAMSPIVDTASLSNTGVHVVPLLVVFHTPPDATPTKTIFGLLSTKQPCGCCQFPSKRHSLHDPLPYRAAWHHTPLLINAHHLFVEIPGPVL